MFPKLPSLDMARLVRPALLVGLLAACARAGATQATAAIRPVHPGCTALPALDSATLMRDLFRIADDSMRGRLIGSTGGMKARDFLAARFDALGLGILPPGRVQVFNVDTTRRRGISRGWNVVGTIPGTRFTDQYIVITAHYDHIGETGAGRCGAIGADSICNGSDDNGSGAVALLTLAKHFMRNRPAHTLLFAELDGEEAGLLGANAFVAAPPVPLEKMLIDVNLDMVSRNTRNELYASGPGRNPALEPLVQGTADCSPIRLLIGHDGGGSVRDDWTNQSDQGAFARKNVPFVYFGVEDHPDYHKPGDSPDRAMPGFFVGAIRTIADFIRRYDGAPVTGR
jgi:hypothetical protein